MITDGRMGMVVQARGVADALGLVVEEKRVVPRGVYKLIAPWGPVQAADRFGVAGSQFAPPWPQVAIGCGRASIPYLRRLKREAGASIFTVYVQDPRTRMAVADLICVPEHDRLRGPNVVVTRTAPHSYAPGRLAALRTEMPPSLRILPSPRVAVVLGGSNGSYRFDDAAHARLSASLRSLAALGASFLVTPSRRTDPELLAAVDSATSAAPRWLWDGQGGDNPYPLFLAHGDGFVVTADSVNMTGEACATGRPVWVFAPGRGSEKFERFHAALRAIGATRPMPDRFETWDTWSYPPVDAAAVIAAEVERRWQRRRAMLGGIVGGG